MTSKKIGTLAKPNATPSCISIEREDSKLRDPPDLSWPKGAMRKRRWRRLFTLAALEKDIDALMDEYLDFSSMQEEHMRTPGISRRKA
jgi:hypothetical protein